MVDEFIKMVSERNHFQNKLLKEWNINENEYLEFENILLIPIVLLIRWSWKKHIFLKETKSTGFHLLRK